MKFAFFMLTLLGILLLLNYLYLMRNHVYILSINLFGQTTFLKNISEMNVRNNSIFFMDTSFLSFEHGIVEIRKRAACAVESAALHHQNRSIYMIYFFPNVTQEYPVLDKFLKPLLNYPNIKIVYAIVDDYVRGTPIENLYKTHIIDSSPYWLTHHSDTLRAVTLLKYGGIYLDTDVVVLKPLDDLGSNFIGIELDGRLASGIMGFEKDGLGYEFLHGLLEELNESYQPTEWAANGPGIFTKWAQYLCETTDLAKFSNKECSTLRILPKEYFYPIYYSSWQKYFDHNYNEEVLKSVKNSYLVHVWNKFSASTRLNVNSNASYVIFARKNCPKLYNQLYKTF